MSDEVQNKRDPTYEEFIEALVEYGGKKVREFSMLNTETKKIHHIIELEHIDALKRKSVHIKYKQGQPVSKFVRRSICNRLGIHTDTIEFDLI